MQYPRRPEVLRRLASADSDGFARWDAGQTLIAECVLALANEAPHDHGDEVLALFETLGKSAQRLPDDGEAKALLAAMLTLAARALAAGTGAGHRHPRDLRSLG